MSRLDLRLSTDLPVPLVVLAALDERSRSLQIPTLIIGAAARDLVVHGPTSVRSPRATLDVDVAIAVDRAGFEAFTHGWPSVRGSEHSFLVCGVEVDVVPFGPIEARRSVVFDDAHVLDVTGLSEAAATAVDVLLPGGLEVRAASLPAQAALKVLAWRDRQARTPKDARDLREILEVAAELPYVNDVWADDLALERAEYDIFLAAAGQGALSPSGLPHGWNHGIGSGVAPRRWLPGGSVGSRVPYRAARARVDDARGSVRRDLWTAPTMRSGSRLDL